MKEFKSQLFLILLQLIKDNNESSQLPAVKKILTLMKVNNCPGAIALLEQDKNNTKQPFTSQMWQNIVTSMNHYYYYTQ